MTPRNIANLSIFSPDNSRIEYLSPKFSEFEVELFPHRPPHAEYVTNEAARIENSFLTER